MNLFKSECDSGYKYGNPLISDAEYDAIFGDEATDMTTDITDSSVTPLPLWMGSLNKTRGEKPLRNWLSKSNCEEYVVSGKLDGISALLDVKDKKLYTRGNGKVGSDISRFLKYMDVDLSTFTTRFVRGELIMKKKVFEMKYKVDFKNARNLVAGQFAKNVIDENVLKDVDFVPYELIRVEKNCQMIPSVQLESSKSSIPWKILARPYVSVDVLTNILNDWVSEGIYNMDGLVLIENRAYERNVSGNPTYSIAFKRENDLEAIETTVTKVKWNLSKWGVYIPVIYVDPINISGVTISKVSGHNAKYIIANDIGPGSRVVCVRSGDVIPYIVSVLKPSKESIVLPEDVIWDGVNLKTTRLFATDIDVKILTNLFIGLGVKNLNLKTFEKMYEECKLTTFFSILNCRDEDLDPCFLLKTRTKIVSEMNKVKKRTIHIHELVGYSGVLGYGFGLRRSKLLFDSLRWDVVPSVRKVMSIEGFGDTLSEQIVKYYPFMITFVKKCMDIGMNIDDSREQQQKNLVKICVSGFRDKELEKTYQVCSNVTKDCSYLVCANVDKKTVKVEKAEALGVKIISRNDFLNL